MCMLPLLPTTPAIFPTSQKHFDWAVNCQYIKCLFLLLINCTFLAANLMLYVRML